MKAGVSVLAPFAFGVEAFAMPAVSAPLWAMAQNFYWITYVFGALLVYAGARLLRKRGVKVDYGQNPLFRLFKHILPTVEDYHGGQLTVVKDAKRYVTPLLLAFIAIETSDILFAVDCVPAIFAVTRDPFIIFTSNIFAILGLRSLYFALARMIDRFRYLDVALSLTLLFAGAKMLLRRMYEISTLASLAVISVLLGLSILASVRRPSSASKVVAAKPRHTPRGDEKYAAKRDSAAPMHRAVRRIAVTVVGFAVLAVGVAMIVLPGPAVVVIPLGLAILASEYAWARRLLQRAKKHAEQLFGRSTRARRLKT